MCTQKTKLNWNLGCGLLIYPLCSVVWSFNNHCPLVTLATTWSTWLSTWLVHGGGLRTGDVYIATLTPHCGWCNITPHVHNMQCALQHWQWSSYTGLHKRSVYFVNAYISYWMPSHSCSRSGKSLWPDVNAGSLEQQLYLTAKCTHHRVGRLYM